MVYKQFIEWHLWCGKSVDVYLAELKKLAFLLDWMNDLRMLPHNVKWTLHALSRMDTLFIDQLLVRAWVIMRDKEMEEVMVVVAAWPMQSTEVDVKVL